MRRSSSCAPRWRTRAATATPAHASRSWRCSTRPLASAAEPATRCRHELPCPAALAAVAAELIALRGHVAASAAAALANTALSATAACRGRHLAAPSWYAACQAALHADRPELVAPVLRGLPADGASAGPGAAAARSIVATQLALALGELQRAEAEAGAALERACELEPGPLTWRLVPGAARAVVRTYIERDRLDDAQSALAALEARLGDRQAPGAMLTAVRAELDLARGLADAVLERCAEAERSERATGNRGPCVWWRGVGAMASHRSDDQGAAVALADAHLEQARAWEAASHVGAALVVRGAIDRGRGRRVAIEQAIGILDGAPAGLELARATVELGSARLGAAPRRQPHGRARAACPRRGPRASLRGAAPGRPRAQRAAGPRSAPAAPGLQRERVADRGRAPGLRARRARADQPPDRASAHGEREDRRGAAERGLPQARRALPPRSRSGAHPRHADRGRPGARMSSEAQTELGLAWLLREPIVTVDGTAYRGRDVVAAGAGALCGRRPALERELVAGLAAVLDQRPARAEVAAATRELRYARKLISAEDFLVWAAGWRLETSDVRASVERGLARRRGPRDGPPRPRRASRRGPAGAGSGRRGQ